VRAFAAAFAAAVGLVLFSVSPAQAGSDGRYRDVFTLQEAADFSKLIERDLAARGARVALVFRSGRDREDLRGGVRYTHGAFWVYTPIELDDGSTVYGYAVYNLFHFSDDQQVSYLEQDWPLDFARGDVVGEVGVIIPSEEMQRRLLDIIASPAYTALHQPNYSLVSNPGDLRFQNCTEFLLDVIAAATWQTTFRPQIKANLRAYFEATLVPSNPIERFFARWGDARLRLNDHRGDIRTATFASISEFMLRYDLAAEVYELASPYQPYPRSGPFDSTGR
jgi:hypothetical protein